MLDYFSYAVVAVAIVAAVLELKTGRISNNLVLLLLAMFVAKVGLGWGQFNIVTQLLFTAAVFVPLFVLFVLGVFGAGVVKLAGAVALFLPPAAWQSLGWMLLGAIVISLIVYTITRKLFGSPENSWDVMARDATPMATAIAITTAYGLFLI